MTMTRVPMARLQGVQLQSNEAKTIEILARRTAILRQQQYTTPASDPAHLPQTLTAWPTATVSKNQFPRRVTTLSTSSMKSTTFRGITNAGLLGRRMSEYGPGQRASPYNST